MTAASGPGGFCAAHRYGWGEGDRVVPVYAFTQGRTRPSGHELPYEALVTATERAVEHLTALQPERRAIVRMSMRPISVVEIGANPTLPAAGRPAPAWTPWLRWWHTL